MIIPAAAFLKEKEIINIEQPVVYLLIWEGKKEIRMLTTLDRLKSSETNKHTNKTEVFHKS